MLRRIRKKSSVSQVCQEQDKDCAGSKTSLEFKSSSKKKKAQSPCGFYKAISLFSFSLFYCAEAVTPARSSQPPGESPESGFR